MSHDVSLPSAVRAIGYTHAPDGLPLGVFDRQVDAPGPDEVLVDVVSSSLNPLDYKLAELNFTGRVPPVALGFDFAGVVIACGEGVKRFGIGDAVFGMMPSDRDGVWVAGSGGLALVPAFMVAPKPDSLSFVEAGVLGVCFLSAYLGLTDHLSRGDTVYIPGGGGGVGHLAVQKARALGAGTIISSGGNEQSRALARSSGADHVFDYRQDDIATEIERLTHGRGVDIVFDATYSEASFVATAKMVRKGGTWVVLGVGPGKTSRVAETESPVAAILAAKGARQENVNILRFFATPDGIDAEARDLLARAIADAATGAVRPHVAASIASAPDPINAALTEMKAGRAALGKIAVVIDAERAR